MATTDTTLSASPPIPPGKRTPPATASIVTRQTCHKGRSTPAKPRRARHRAAPTTVLTALSPSSAARRPSRTWRNTDAIPGSQRRCAHSSLPIETSPVRRCRMQPEASRDTATFVDPGESASQQLSRTGMTHATNASAASANVQANRRLARRQPLTGPFRRARRPALRREASSSRRRSHVWPTYATELVTSRPAPN